MNSGCASALWRISFVESITPDIEQSASDAEFPGERNDVVARIHSFIDSFIHSFIHLTA
jgi:hypothetical protein